MTASTRRSQRNVELDLSHYRLNDRIIRHKVILLDRLGVHKKAGAGAERGENFTIFTSVGCRPVIPVYFLCPISEVGTGAGCRYSVHSKVSYGVVQRKENGVLAVENV